jgi:hypothetical protein
MDRAGLSGRASAQTTLFRLRTSEEDRSYEARSREQRKELRSVAMHTTLIPPTLGTQDNFRILRCLFFR